MTFNVKFFNRTMTHELGHGAFAWQHPFDLTEEKISTNNLMDYVKDDDLAYFQWQSTLGLNLTWGFLEGDEDGMYDSSSLISGYYFTWLGDDLKGWYPDELESKVQSDKEDFKNLKFH
ncbi:MAG: hypothetical protein MJZ34_08960 [Paludibacteraceae bacterium]|nr:hypothetical protein [Paludibacteraceae bacterium]